MATASCRNSSLQCPEASRWSSTTGDPRGNFRSTAPISASTSLRRFGGSSRTFLRARCAPYWRRPPTMRPTTFGTIGSFSNSGTEMSVPFLDLHEAYRELAHELDAASRRVMESGSYILGKEVEAFGHEFAEYVGVRHSIGLPNALQP